MKLSLKSKERFQKTVWDFYATNKRDTLPWRKKITPYYIWISEVMLQQTQVDRTIPFFKNWMKKFPTIAALAHAPQSEVLRLWKGLGYNSRALRLKKTAEIITEKYHGKFPKAFAEILELPGIGPYTAGAILAFAYDQKVTFIETNIRRVFIHEFFQGKDIERTISVHDRDILDLITQTLPEKNIRQWYWALMDYGSYLGKSLQSQGKRFNPNTKSRHYTKQSKFQGSDRQIRGKILEILLDANQVSFEKLFGTLKKLSDDTERIEMIVVGLEKEGFLVFQKNKISLKK